ncbi:MAG: ribbon-helix-helix protein, CopG family [Nocardioidaceae bacterium]
MSKYKLEPGSDVDLETEDVRDSEGRRITQEYVDKAVADVHEHVARGRPSLTGRGKHSPQVSFRVPTGLREGAERLAAERGETISQLAREALEEYVEQRKAS